MEVSLRKPGHCFLAVNINYTATLNFPVMHLWDCAITTVNIHGNMLSACRYKLAMKTRILFSMSMQIPISFTEKLMALEHVKAGKSTATNVRERSLDEYCKENTNAD